MSWMDLIDSKLEKLFSAKPDNAAKVTERRREGCVQGIDNALKALKAGEAKGPRGWYLSKDNVTRASLRSGTRTVSLKGQDFVYLPTERAVDFYGDLKKDVAAGRMDDAINAAWATDGGTTRTRGQRSTKGKAMAPETVYGRNLNKGMEKARAYELLVKRFGKETADRVVAQHKGA